MAYSSAWRWFLRTLFSVLWIVAACGDETLLIVQVRADLEPVTEFDLVEVAVADRVVEHAVAPGSSYRDGVRVAEIGGLAEGATVVAARLLLGSEVIATESMNVVVSGRTAITLDFGCPSCTDAGLDASVDAGPPAIDAGRPDGAANDAGVTCECADGTGVCDPRSGTCTTPGPCSAIEPCPSGYSCLEPKGTCLCTDDVICGPTCDAATDCDVFFLRECDPRRGVCRVPRTCVDDAMCPVGANCRFRGDSPPPAVCGRTVGAADGEDCLAANECASGVCRGVCVPRCRVNRDCPAALECTAASDQRGCQVPSGPRCADGEYRDWDGCAVPCTANADCGATGACGTSGAGSLLRCRTGPTICAPGEFDYDRVVCLSTTACWEDADCPSIGTTCMQAEDASTPFPFPPLLGTSGLCGHR